MTILTIFISDSYVLFVESISEPLGGWQNIWTKLIQWVIQTEITQIDILLCFKKFLPISEPPETLSCPEYRHKMLQKLGVLFDGEYDTN